MLVAAKNYMRSNQPIRVTTHADLDKTAPIDLNVQIFFVIFHIVFFPDTLYTYNIRSIVRAQMTYLFDANGMVECGHGLE